MKIFGKENVYCLPKMAWRGDRYGQPLKKLVGRKEGKGEKL